MLINNKGQTMVEAVVALSIILIIITSLSVVVVSSLYNSQFIKEQNRANKYSQQGMEIVRNIQKNNLARFTSFTGGPFCVNATGTDLILPASCNSAAQTVGGNLNRTINFDQGVPLPGSNLSTLPCDIHIETKVTVTTKWTSSKCGATPYCHKSVITSCLSYISIYAP